jgi:hypothetical protein
MVASSIANGGAGAAALGEQPLPSIAAVTISVKTLSLIGTRSPPPVPRMFAEFERRCTHAAGCGW